MGLQENKDGYPVVKCDFNARHEKHLLALKKRQRITVGGIYQETEHLNKRIPASVP